MRKLIFALVVLAMAAPAAAAPILVTSPAGLVADGTIGWGVLGGSSTTVANPFTISVPGVSGLDVTVSQAGQSLFERRDQGSGWNGNFAPGEKLLWSRGSYGPMTFLFDQDIAGFGTQIQRDQFGAFTAYIDAWDVYGNLLGSFSVAGNSTYAGDDAAPFIGILNNVQNIRRVRLNTSGYSDFAISDVLVQGDGGQEPIPEPTSMVLLGTGLVGAAIRRYRRKA